MKPDDLIDIVLPTAPQTDWLSVLMGLGEGFGGILLIWGLWKLLPAIIRPLAFRHQLMQLNRHYHQMPIEQATAIFYQWAKRAKHCDVWQDEAQQVALFAYLNQACFSNHAPQHTEMTQWLQTLQAVFSYTHIWASMQRRALKTGQSWRAVIEQNIRSVWQTWRHK